MLESSLEGIAVIRGTEIEESNRAFRLLVEQASPGDEAKELHALIAPASWPALEELLASASSKPIALQLRSNDGQPRFVEMASGRVGAGKNSVTVVTMRDITALRQWEAGIEESKRATEEAAVAKGQFLANMSHELRTPLNGIIGMSDLLRRTELTAEQDDYLNTIMASGQHLQTIISNLLDYNRLEAQKIVLESRTFSVWDFVENTMNMIYPLAAKRGIELMHSIDSAVPEAVNGDEFRLRQVLFNLMGNAVKFTEQGHVALQVSWENHRLRFSVVDTGIGIPKDRIASLFSPFVQADHSTTRRFGGTGLGLVISHELVNLMGGTIEVTSEPGFGSTFEFSLPLPIVEAPAKPAPSKAGGILLLTSNDVIASHLQSILLPAGYSVVRQDESVPESIAAIVVDWPLTETIAPTELDLVQALQENPRARLVVLANSTVDESTFPRHEILARCRKPIRRRELLAAIDGSLLPVENGKSLDNGGGLPPAISKLRILVADDDPTNRKVLHEYLQRLGASATFAVDGDEALRKALTSSFDLLLIDYQMPGKDGLEVMRQLRGTPNPCQASFLVLLTADARPERAKAALAAGANRHVAKPVSLATIQGLLMEQITNQSGSSSQATNSPEVGPGKVMDFSVADELHKALGDTAFRQLLSTFLTELKSLHKKMVSSVKAKNADEARRVFHTIGSSAATFGAIELQRLARKAEHACEGGSTAAAAEFVAPIEIGISEVQSHFAAVLSGKK
jgi:two-component system, sensor histidine kinase and response regulator